MPQWTKCPCRQYVPGDTMPKSHYTLDDTRPWVTLGPETLCPVQARSDSFRPLQTRSDPFRPVQTPSDPFRSIQTRSGPFRPIQTPSDPFRPFQTRSDHFRHIQIHSDPFRLVQPRSALLCSVHTDSVALLESFRALKLTLTEITR